MGTLDAVERLAGEKRELHIVMISDQVLIHIQKPFLKKLLERYLVESYRNEQVVRHRGQKTNLASAMSYFEGQEGSQAEGSEASDGGSEAESNMSDFLASTSDDEDGSDNTQTSS